MEGDNTLVPSRNKLLDEKVNSPRGAKSSVAETPAALPPSPPPDPDALAGAVVRELDPDSIKLLMQKGSQFVMSGDLVSARLVFLRAAEAGNAAAALALGSTYDPVWLAKRGTRGVGTDIEKARSWYEQARKLGSPDAPYLLEMLAARQ